MHVVSNRPELQKVVSELLRPDSLLTYSELRSVMVSTLQVSRFAAHGAQHIFTCKSCLCIVTFVLDGLADQSNTFYLMFKLQSLAWATAG